MYFDFGSGMVGFLIKILVEVRDICSYFSFIFWVIVYCFVVCWFLLFCFSSNVFGYWLFWLVNGKKLVKLCLV